MINIDNIPRAARKSIDNYVKHRIPPGGFMSSVISNDLMMACAKADGINIHHLPEIVAYLWNYCPADCWGSPEKMTAWLEATDND